MKQNSKFLLILIFVAFFVRVLILWIGRPEFVGWFNHTYYYYVQTNGLLENGTLPFPDMPLLFYIYTITAKLLTWFGIDNNVAIVIATRFWMSLIPSLLPIPFYVAFKSIYKKQTLPKWIWVFLFASAFYPLSILHMPEFLQKNTLGLLLVAVLIQQSIKVLEYQSIKRFGRLVFLFLLIVLTHFGSTAVAILYIASLLLSFFIHKRITWTPKLTLGLIFGLGISLLAFYLMDIQRFERIGYYVDRILDSSSLALVFSSDDPDKFISILTIIVPLGVATLFYYYYKKVAVKVDYENSLFWLANIIFCYLLVLPIYDSTLIARFVIYMSLPLIYVLVFTIQYTITKQWIKKITLGLVVFGTVAIGGASIATLFFLNKSKGEVYLDLMEMKKSVIFNDNDLIITRHGAEHISNWFLGTKSCLITSFSSNDLQKYDRVFILNPKEKSKSLASDSNEASRKYYYMVSNIQEPEESKILYESTHMKLLQLKVVPEEWKFDSKGNWIAYVK